MSRFEYAYALLEKLLFLLLHLNITLFAKTFLHCW